MPGLKPGFGRLATLTEVFDILYDHLPQLGAESVRVADALHRVTAAPITSPIEVPHFAKAAMDGYAVVASDTYGASDQRPIELKVVDVALPGQIATEAAGDGRCIEIGTGAMLPSGADAVVMVEYTEAAGDVVSVRKPVAPRENVIEPGSDIAAGTTIVAAGVRLEPRHLGAIAATGVTEIQVVRRPKVALFSTGPELIEAGGVLEEGRIFDINSYTLHGALEVDGCEVVDLGIVPDEVDVLDKAMQTALAEADIVLLSGGSSLGGGDLVGEAFAKAGEMLVHGAAVKPGKPVVLGVAHGTGKMMIGLPGYPMSALSDYYIFVQPYLRKAQGIDAEPLYRDAILARKHPSTVGRYEFLPVQLDGDRAVPVMKGSSSISAMADADGFVEIDENTEVVEKGAAVRVRLF